MYYVLHIVAAEEKLANAKKEETNVRNFFFFRARAIKNNEADLWNVSASFALFVYPSLPLLPPGVSGDTYFL
jgi:hypothetical protein